jgi:hypothetical protein
MAAGCSNQLISSSFLPYEWFSVIAKHESPIIAAAAKRRKMHSGIFFEGKPYRLCVAQQHKLCQIKKILRQGAKLLLKLPADLGYVMDTIRRVHNSRFNGHLFFEASNQGDQQQTGTGFSPHTPESGVS